MQPPVPPPSTDGAPERQVEVVGPLGSEELAVVAALVEAATEADGVRPLSEHAMLHLRYGGDAAVRNVLVYEDGVLAAYGHVDPTDLVSGASAEVVVHPTRRGAGLGRLLVQAALDEAPAGRLRLWAHGDHPAASALAASMGFTRVRALWQMRRSLYAALPRVPLPDGVTVRTFRPGTDDDAWLRLNAEAFRDHPEQGTWTSHDLHQRMAEPWFDPEGFFLAERDGALVGFHWTKVHGSTTDEDAGAGHGHDAIGEVYVVGVAPSEHGRGLGKALTVVGLQHLRQRGLPDAMLYVEADNTAAVRLYTGLGFTRWETDVMFSREPRSDEPDGTGAGAAASSPEPA
jgi:mycothiol synthase